MCKESSFYSDDVIQLDRYHRLIESLCADEVCRIRNLCWVDTVDEPVIVEEVAGVHVSQHDMFSDVLTDALYDVYYKFFVAYHGRLQLLELSVEPVPSGLVQDVPFPWEGGEA